MPSKANSRAPQANWPQTTFVNYKLNAEEKKQFSTWQQKHADELPMLLAVFISEGHKISLSWDDTNKCYIASATCKDAKSANLDHCLTSRSGDWYEALMLNLFKASELLGDQPWADLSEGGAWG